MSTHNICFRGEIGKIFTGYPPLSRPMHLLDTSLVTYKDWLKYFTVIVLILQDNYGIKGVMVSDIHNDYIMT